MRDKNKGKVILYLMRHGQTILNKARRTQGWCDSVLTKEGIEVAVNVGLGLSDIKFKAAYSSDLGRAVRTARIVMKENIASSNLELKELEGLREVYFGKYEGELESVKTNDVLTYLKVNSFEEVEEKYDMRKAYFDSIAALDETKEAEDYNIALKRVKKSLEDICIENSHDNGGNVLVVCHGAMLRVIISYLDKSSALWSMDNSSISKIIYEDGNFVVESVNDSTYSEKGKAMKK